jgi:uncharacterized protein (TIRG00374 family)
MRKLMVTEKEFSLKRTVPFLLLGILIFVAYLHFFVGIPQILAIIRDVNLIYYGMAAAILVLNMFTAALTWQGFLHLLSIKVPFRKTVIYTWVGVFVDLLVPAESISGDATKVYVMTKNSGENAGKVVASVLGHRILNMIIPLGSLIVSFVMLYARNIEVPVSVSALIVLVIVGTSISLFFIFLLSSNDKLAQRLIGAVLRFLGFVTRGRLNVEGLNAKATMAFGAFHDSIDTFSKNPKGLIQPIVFSLVGWFLSILLSYMVFVSLGQQVDLAVIMVVHSVSVTVQAIPLGIPGEVGVVDTAMTWLYGLLAVEFTVGAAATVLIQILRVWLRIVVGFVMVQFVGIKSLADDLRQDLF